MIKEIRTYKFKPTHREEFIYFLGKNSVPSMQAFGIKIIAPFIDLKNPNKFVWIGSFKNFEERDKMKTAFYESETLKNKTEGVVMPILDAYGFVLCATYVKSRSKRII